MPHPDGGKKPKFPTQHTFVQALELVGNKSDGLEFPSSTNHSTMARVGNTDSGKPAIAFRQEGNGGGNVCQNCWGFTDSPTPAQAQESANGFAA